MVGIYAPNEATQRIALWGSLLQTLYVGRPGLLKGDFNMCADASQSTFEHSIMDDHEQLAWDSLAMEFLKLDVWTWLPLLPWTKKALHSLLQPLRYLLWKKSDKMGITWVAWNHLATPKRLGGTGILNYDGS